METSLHIVTAVTDELRDLFYGDSIPEDVLFSHEYALLKSCVNTIGITPYRACSFNNHFFFYDHSTKVFKHFLKVSLHKCGKLRLDYRVNRCSLKQQEKLKKNLTQMFRDFRVTELVLIYDQKETKINFILESAKSHLGVVTITSILILVLFILVMKIEAIKKS